jgi:hypothetical protein
MAKLFRIRRHVLQVFGGGRKWVVAVDGVLLRGVAFLDRRCLGGGRRGGGSGPAVVAAGDICAIGSRGRHPGLSRLAP